MLFLANSGLYNSKSSTNTSQQAPRNVLPAILAEEIRTGILAFESSSKIAVDINSNLPPCCQKEKSAKDCCTDELQVIHTYIDEVQPTVEQFNLVCDLTTLAFTPTTIFLHSWPISIQRHPSFLDKRPPPLHRTGRHIQTLHQIWQI